jgi:Collagen triple helix repeat (20 copies)
MRNQSAGRLKLFLLAAVMAALGASNLAMATPVQYQINLIATIGNQFGVPSPATFTGTFTVDSTFLQQADGSYAGTNVTGFNIVIGSEDFNAATASNPDVQGVQLTGHQIVGMAMNWYQTSAGLSGPFLQMAENGVWFAGSTANQAGSAILQGPAGSQSFSQISSANVIANDVPPLATDGQDGYYYIDAANGALYGPKAGGAWPGNPFSLVGSTGPQGSAGPAGPEGPAGQAGTVGPTGQAGAVGPAGPVGVAGAVGPAGQTGPVGPTGAIGPAGPAGTAGAVGAIGPVGAVGPAGPIGPTGPAGPAGAGLISGSLLFLPQGTPAPAGYTVVGTTLLILEANPLRPETITVYKKN